VRLPARSFLSQSSAIRLYEVVPHGEDPRQGGRGGEINVRDFFRRTVVVNRHAYTSPGAETGPPGARPAPYRDDFVVTEHQGDHAFHADMTDWYLLTNDDMQEEPIRYNNGSSKARILSGEKRNGN